MSSLSSLSDVLARGALTDQCEGYLYGRGVKQRTILELGCITWQPPDHALFDDPQWLRYGKQGRAENLEGWLIIPLLSPRGRVLGFEGRRTDVKRITRYLLPGAAWNPVWVGLTPSAMQRLWAGGDAWLSEGFFDVAALEWCVPETDASLGTVRAKLSQKHIEFLRRFCRGTVNMVYDNDEAGRKGTHDWVDDSGKTRWGALHQLRHAGLSCRAIPYAGGKDPGEIWDRGGVEGLQAAFNRRIS